MGKRIPIIQNHVREDGTLTLMGELAQRPRIAPPVSAPAPVPEPAVPEPIPVKRLSLDSMIGICCLLLVWAYGGYSFGFIGFVGGIVLAIWSWRRLDRVAPVTAQVVLCILGIFLLGLLGLLGGGFGRGGRGGRGRRW